MININIKHYTFYYKLRSLPFVNEIALFGSRAKHNSCERSDIDLAITCPKATEIDWQLILKIIDDADTLLKIDCVRLDTLKDNRLLLEIEKSKVIIFKRVENNYPWYEIFLDLGEALEKFLGVLNVRYENFPYAIEATIQIFEYSFELYWKLLKKICITEGLEANSPRSTLQQAYSIKLIDNEQVWLEMMEDRNMTSHTYKQIVANEIYERCDKYRKLMQTNYDKIKLKYSL